jgi:hypothetical protein
MYACMHVSASACASVYVHIMHVHSTYTMFTWLRPSLCVRHVLSGVGARCSRVSTWIKTKARPCAYIYDTHSIDQYTHTKHKTYIFGWCELHQWNHENEKKICMWAVTMHWVSVCAWHHAYVYQGCMNMISITYRLFVQNVLVCSCD